MNQITKQGEKMENKCPICGGSFEHGFSTFSIDRDNQLVVLRKVPAMICSVCGEEYFEDSVLKRIEKNIPKKKANQIEILAYS